MKRNRRVKIVATLGPASSDPDMLERLFAAGVDVFRINMSHSTHEVARELHAAIRNAEVRFNRPIGILCDLQGPKFRIGSSRARKRTIVSRATSSARDQRRAWETEQGLLAHPKFSKRSSPATTSPQRRPPASRCARSTAA